MCVGHCQCDCVVGKPVASVSFSSPAETLLEVVYPNPHKIISKSSVLGNYTHTFDHAFLNTILVSYYIWTNVYVYMCVLILGDDSVLLKYLNPNMVAVTTAIHSATSTDRSGLLVIQLYPDLLVVPTAIIVIIMCCVCV